MSSSEFYSILRLLCIGKLPQKEDIGTLGIIIENDDIYIPFVLERLSVENEVFDIETCLFNSSSNFDQYDYVNKEGLISGSIMIRLIEDLLKKYQFLSPFTEEGIDVYVYFGLFKQRYLVDLK